MDPVYEEHKSAKPALLKGCRELQGSARVSRAGCFYELKGFRVWDLRFSFVLWDRGRDSLFILTEP